MSLVVALVDVAPVLVVAVIVVFVVVVALVVIVVVVFVRAQVLSESRGGRPGLDQPYWFLRSRWT